MQVWALNTDELEPWAKNGAKNSGKNGAKNSGTDALVKPRENVVSRGVGCQEQERDRLKVEAAAAQKKVLCVCVCVCVAGCTPGAIHIYM